MARVPASPSSGQPKRSRNHPAAGQRSIVRVDKDFVEEYPEADATCTELFASLLVVADVLMELHEPRIEATLGTSQTAAQALAVLDGAGEPLTPSQIGERLLVSSATMTSLLDTLEQRGWVLRTPNPDDRRSLLIEITEAGRATADVFLPGLHKLERSVMSELDDDERAQLLGLLERVLARANAITAEPMEPLSGVRHRPARLR
ncbi:MAG: MarR family winged helix-turn-helix transcriptional regulator [Ilumatobacteraceae bacterium]